jgi:hypothetical protein
LDKTKSDWFDYAIEQGLATEEDFEDICGEDIDFAVIINPSLEYSLFGNFKDEVEFKRFVLQETANYDFNIG